MNALRKREDGQTMAEYSIVLAVLTIAVAAVFTALSGGVASALSSVTAIV
jgi:Flp pilus assembly pilin Flp